LAMSRSPVSENEKKIEAQMLSVGVGGDEADADADADADVVATGVDVDVDVVNVVTGVDVCNGADSCDEVVKDGNGRVSALVLTLTV